METLKNLAASESGVKTLTAVATTTSGILMATLIRKKIWPLTVRSATFIWTQTSSLAILSAKFVKKLAGLTTSVVKRVFQRTDEGTASGDAQGEGV